MKGLDLWSYYCVRFPINRSKENRAPFVSRNEISSYLDTLIEKGEYYLEHEFFQAGGPPYSTPERDLDLSEALVHSRKKRRTQSSPESQSSNEEEPSIEDPSDPSDYIGESVTIYDEDR